MTLRDKPLSIMPGSSQGDQEVYKVVQFQVMEWPASGVVHHPGLVTTLMDTVNTERCKMAQGPVVIHCR